MVVFYIGSYYVYLDYICLNGDSLNTSMYVFGSHLGLQLNRHQLTFLFLFFVCAAFKFCLQYTRKAEFRKLCDNLRMHLGQIQRHHNQSTAINLNNPDSQSMHLETRLVQLDSAISMELWQVCNRLPVITVVFCLSTCVLNALSNGPGIALFA